MQRMLNGKIGLLLAAIVTVSPHAALAADAPPLPPGVTVQKSPDGLVLAQAGKLLYRIDLDRFAKRRRGNPGLAEARWAEFNTGLWSPVAAPKDFRADGDWSVTPRPSGDQLTYKGDPLYSFTGRNLEEAGKAQFAPPYFSSYAAKPTLLVSGVPAATLYYHPALYQPAPPKVTAPSGVTARWSKVAYVFADAENRGLYAAGSSRPCAKGCDGLKPFAAPLAAIPVGEWRPVQQKDGQRLWAYRGRIVYQAQSADADAPGGDWSQLEVR